MARYTDVTVRYVPRFGGHGSIRFRYNMKKKEIYYARFLFIYFEQTVEQIKKNPSRCENTTYYYMLYTVAAGTYFEQGGLRNKTGWGGGGGSRDKSDARHYDPKAQLLLIKVSFIRLI